MKENTKITCPNCDAEIDVNDILKHQIEDNLKKEFLAEKLKLEKDLKTKNETLQETIRAKNEQLAKEKADFEAKKERENELFTERLEKEKKQVAISIENKLKAKLNEENEDRYAAVQKELQEKSEKIKELYQKEAEIAKLKREKEEIQLSVQAESDKKLNEAIAAERENAKKAASESAELVIKELQLQLEQQKKLTDEMKRKQEQGSMQSQGEVQELAMEEWLMSNFPLDTIEEIKKGATGADCLQIVHTREIQNCGTIYYESKRTKNFSPAWIEKFKNDIRDKNANIGVLVSEVLPSDMERMGLREGIWICTFQEFKGLSLVLRQSIINGSKILASQENKGDKMALLYDFLISNEFRLQMEGIVEGFQTMQIDLIKEQTAMKKLWKKRATQIEKVTLNSVNMYGAIKGIAGKSIPSIKALELDSDDELALE